METPMERRLAQLTSMLCDIPSTTGNEQEICDRVEDWARTNGRFIEGDIRRIGNSLVLGNLSDTSRPLIALVGHLDTVPGTGIPSKVEVASDGRLRVTGLGSSDMKCGLAVMMALAEDLDRSALPVNPVFVFYDREEGPFEENGLGPLLDQSPELNRSAFAVVLESTDGEIQMACQGSLHARVTFEGKSCHSARPWHGENAIYKAISLLSDLAAKQPVPITIDGFTFYEVMSATLAEGGTARNVIPNAFHLNLNFRFSPSRTVEEAMAVLESFVGDRGSIQWLDKSPAGKVCAHNPHYLRLAKITGAKTTPKQAWTDVARLAQKGIDSVNFGPGLTAMAHQVGEWAPADEITRCYDHLKAFLMSS